MHRLLLVDDDPMLGPLVTRILGKEYNVSRAETLKAADELVAKETFDLVLLDVSLPDGDGFEFRSKLRAMGKFRDVPIVFMTGHSDLVDKETGAPVPAEDYIVKPCSVQELRERVRTALAGRAPRAAVSKG
jgi:DNA-binding response OmpR family regulator